MKAVPWSAEELVWIAVSRELPRRLLYEEFVRIFDRRDVKPFHLKDVCKRHGYLTGRSHKFAKGNVPVHRAPPGHERIDQYGFVLMSVEGRGRYSECSYVPKHIYCWEAAHGPIPRGMYLIPLTSDKTNCDPSNWMLVTGGERNRIYARGYNSAPDEVKVTIRAVAKLGNQLAEHHRRHEKVVTMSDFKTTHTIAQCRDCEWRSEDLRRAETVARAHAGATKHTVVIERAQVATINRKPE